MDNIISILETIKSYPIWQLFIIRNQSNYFADTHKMLKRRRRRNLLALDLVDGGGGYDA